MSRQVFPYRAWTVATIFSALLGTANALAGGLEIVGLRQAVMEMRVDENVILQHPEFGGAPADIKDSPWQVALIYARFSEPVRAQFCGGSIVAKQWVLTAAHCITAPGVRGDVRQVQLVANSTFYGTGGDRLDVDKIVVHDDFNPRTGSFDVALLRIKQNGARLVPISLADSTIVLNPGQLLSVAGWGSRSSRGPGRPYLVAANIPYVASETCKSSYGSELTSDAICAGLETGGLDACLGDSGGPAVVRKGSSVQLVAVVRSGTGCGEEKKYGIYTDVRPVRSWIVKVVGS